MFDDNPFFIIPVYRCSPEQYLDELEERRKKLTIFFTSDLPEELKNTYDVKPLVEKSLDWKCWKYNEIIGYIELYILGDQIRGSLYFVDNKRVRKDIKSKKITKYGKIFELSTNYLNTDDILKYLMYELGQIQLNNIKLKNRYIDFSGISKISKFVDWKGLVQNNR